MAKATRRVHRKSRFGCDVCKRRHIKCDERRPTCTNCEVSHRRCVFQDQSPLVSTNANSRSHAVPALPTTLGYIPTQQPTPTAITGDAATIPETGPIVDMVHAELLIHYSFSVAVPGFEPDLETAATSLVLRQGLAYSWLMYAILAISARHLASRFHQGPEMRHGDRHYHEHAATLQTKALSLFNADMKTIDINNCTAAVLFASIVGRHLLADTLGHLVDSSAPDLDAILGHYDHYVNVHRGMRAIVSEAMALLPHTDSWPLMMWCGLGTTHDNHANNDEDSQDSSGASYHLAALRNWIRASSAQPTIPTPSPAPSPLGPVPDSDSAAACLDAIDVLNKGFRDMKTKTSPFRRHQTSVIWAVLCPPAFQDLLRSQCPKALVVLAYYGVLLHHAQDIWQVAGAGSPLVWAIADFLGSEYAEQMQWPLAVIARD